MTILTYFMAKQYLRLTQRLQNIKDKVYPMLYSSETPLVLLLHLYHSVEAELLQATLCDCNSPSCMVTRFQPSHSFCILISVGRSVEPHHEKGRKEI